MWRAFDKLLNVIHWSAWRSFYKKETTILNKMMPKKIYRYQKFNAQNIEALCQDQLNFSQPEKFNDPLDCKAVVEQDSDKSTLRDILKELIRIRVEKEIINSLKAAKVAEDVPVERARKHADQNAKAKLSNISYHATNPDYTCSVEEAECRLLTFAIQGELLKQNDHGVCCFSATYSDPLLWSHYGDQHRGFCAGYSLNRNPAPEIHKVLYGGNRFVKTSLIAAAILKKDPVAEQQLNEKIFLRKAASWQYEKEWRILDDIGPQDSPLLLEEIIFGLRCPDAVVYTIVSALKPRKIKFFEMYNVSGSFTLKRRAPDLGELSAFFPRTAMSGIEMFDPIEGGE